MTTASIPNSTPQFQVIRGWVKKFVTFWKKLDINNFIVEESVLKISLRSHKHEWSQFFGGPIELATLETIKKVHDNVLADYEWSLGYERAIRMIGIVFAHNWSKKESYDNLKRVFGAVQPQSGRFIGSCYRWNMHLSQHPALVETLHWGFWDWWARRRQRWVCQTQSWRVFWNTRGTIPIDNLQKRGTINGE